MNIKTIIVILILLVPVGYSLMKLLHLFTRKETGCDCSTCPSSLKNNCNSKNNRTH